MAAGAQGYADRARPLPCRTEEVTAVWLTEWLQLAYPGVVVSHLDIRREIPGHTTKLLLSLQLDAAGQAAGLPRKVCLKGNFTGNAMSSAVCINEARFYKELCSRLPLPVPRHFMADWDDSGERRQGLALLEDMEELGGRFLNSAHPLSIDAMAEALETMASFHSATWNHPELDRHPWLQIAMGPDTPTDDYWSMMEEYYERHNRLAERVAIFPSWFRHQPDRLREAWRQLRARDQQSPEPRCLVHGDSHLGNTYGLPDGRRLWFDWQIVRKGRPWRDLTYFLVGSLTIADRRLAERDLVRHYCEHMVRGGVALDFEQAFDEYRRWVIWGLVAWQSNINPGEVTMEPLERFCRASDDLQTESFYWF
jgi:Phosphotransferase enzyme family